MTPPRKPPARGTVEGKKGPEDGRRPLGTIDGGAGVEPWATRIREMVATKGLVPARSVFVEELGCPLATVDRALKYLRGQPGGVVYRRASPRGYILKGGGKRVGGAKKGEVAKKPAQKGKAGGRVAKKRAVKRGKPRSGKPGGVPAGVPTGGKVSALTSKNDTLWQETTSGTLPESSFEVVENAEDEEPPVVKVLEQIKKQFLHTCPRCASPMKKTFIVIGGNRRILVNQCRVCKFYLPA
ncbi:MAG: hypothetical protein ACTSU5_12955 [Promethearchaeota archaeon]